MVYETAVISHEGKGFVGRAKPKSVISMP